MNKKSWLLLAFLYLFLSYSELLAQIEQDTNIWSIDFADVVVTAQFVPTDSRRALQDIKTIRQDVIRQRGVTNLEGLLRQETGIRIRQDLVLGSSMSLLGMDGQNVKIMIDEVPVIGRQGGNIDLSHLNLQNIERVEIVEGPLSVNYGTNASAGVINLITKKDQVKKYKLGFTTQYETREERRIGLDLGAKVHPKLLLQANVAFDKFNGFGQDSLRSSLWNPKEQWMIGSSINYEINKKQNLRYTFSFFDEEVSNLGVVRRPQFKPYAFDDIYQTNRIDHTLSFNGGISPNFYVKTIAGYNKYKRHKNTYRTNFEDNEQTLVPEQQDTSEFNAFMLRSTLASRFKNKPFNFQLGIDLRHDNAIGKRILNENGGKPTIGDYAIFGSFRYTGLPKLQVETGLRYAYNTRYDSPIIPSVNLKYDLTKNVIVRAAYGNGFRSPDLKELFFRFIDINHFIIGNPDLQAERFRNVQVGILFTKEWKNNTIDIKLKGYHNRIQDKITIFEFIETETGIQPAVVESTGQFAYFNQSIFKTQGLTSSIAYNFKNLEWSVSHALIGYYNDLHQVLENVSTYTYANELNTAMTYFFPQQAMRFSLFLRKNDRLLSYYPEQNDVGETIAKQRLQDGYTQLDFTMNKSLLKKKLHLSAGVKNILNIQQVNFSGGGGGAHSGSSTSRPIGPGRSFFVNATLNLVW